MSPVEEHSINETFSEIIKIQISEIDTEDVQFRFRQDFPDDEIKTLASSIKEIGLQNPIKVREKDNKFQMMSGWKRLRGVKLLGLETIQAEVFHNLTDEQAYLINTAENIHRTQLSGLETANIIARLYEVMDMSKSDIADWLSIGYQRVCDLYTLTFMKHQLQDAVHNGSLKLYHAVELNKFPEDFQIEYLMRAIDERWSVQRIKEERGSLVHPFTNAYSEKDKAWMENKFVALRFHRHPLIEPLFEKEWELLGKGFGIPGPFKCQCTSTIRAKKQDPPFFCRNDIKYAVVAKGRLDPRGRDVEKPSDDIQDWPAWAFLCQKCTAYMFPGVIYKDDILFNIPLKNLAKVDDEAPSI